MKHHMLFYLALLLGQLHTVPRANAQLPSVSRPRGEIMRGASTPMLIERALAGGRITLDQWALYNGYALRDPGKLPGHYRSDVPEKCGTWILQEIHRRWSGLTTNARAGLMRLGFSDAGILTRPTGLDSTRGTTHFLVHYSVLPGDTNAVSSFDGDANGTPDIIDTVLTTIEHVWLSEVTTMGYTAPPPDGGLGGDDRYDVYVMKTGYYGYTAGDFKVGDNPNSPSAVETNAHATHLVLNNNYTGYPTTGSKAIEVTTAHEFHHAIQSGYDNDRAAWYGEATATWIEDEVYDSINDNVNYLGEWFSHPDVPLDTNNYIIGTDTITTHAYGSWIFFRYLSEHVSGGPNLIRRILELTLGYDNTNGNHSFEEIGGALAERSTNFTRVFREFTGANAALILSPYRYREGTLYPRMAMSQLENDTTVSGSLDRHSSMYFRISREQLPTCTKLLTVTFTSQDAQASLGVQAVICSRGFVTLVPFQSGITLPGDITPDSLFIVVMNLDFPRVTGNFQLSVYTELRSNRYTLTDLGRIGSSGSVSAVNNKGHLVGTLFTVVGSFSYYTPVKWINGTVTYLGSNASAFDINNNDEIVGSVNIPGGAHAYYWGPAFSVSMDTVTAGLSRALAISDSGIAVGSAFFPRVGGGTETNAQPFIWRNSGMTKLPVFQDSSAIGGVAIDISNRSQILGTITARDTAYPYSAHEHSVLWNGGGGVPEDLGVISVRHLNDLGLLVGSQSVNVVFDGMPTPLVHAMKGSGGAYSDLGTIDNVVGNSSAMALNNLGDIVGGSRSATGAHAFLYSHGAMEDLNALLPSGACWTLQSATAISDSGYIAGTGIPASDNQPHGYLLTPAAPTGVRERPPLPPRFVLYQNYPNPFNPSTEIKYELPVQEFVTLKLYDVLGREVATLVSGRELPGTYSVMWDAGGKASGVYYCRMQAGEYSSVKKIMVLK